MRSVCLVVFVSFVSFSSLYSQGLVGDVLNYTNKFRKSQGLTGLISSKDLNVIAQRHSENMARGRIGFGHDGFNSRYNEARKKIKNVRLYAENVAYGARTGKEVVTGWKNSPVHRSNMLGKYRYIGIGAAKDRRGVIYYTQIFAG